MCVCWTLSTAFAWGRKLLQFLEHPVVYRRAEDGESTVCVVQHYQNHTERTVNVLDTIFLQSFTTNYATYSNFPSFWVFQAGVFKLLCPFKFSIYFLPWFLTHYYLQMTSLLFLTQKTICNRQSIYYVAYLQDIIWKLPQKRRRYLESNVYWTAHHCNSWRMKDQLDVTCYFISFHMCSTCFGN